MTVGSFDLMKTEVTMCQYRKCVDVGVCSLPKDKSASKHQPGLRPRRPSHQLRELEAGRRLCDVGRRLPTKRSGSMRLGVVVSRSTRGERGSDPQLYGDA